jgi:ribonuclease T1
MADGSRKAIEKVKKGDQVLSKDEVTGKIVKQSVVSTKVRTAPSTLVIEVEGGTRAETTPEHPFYVEGTGWTPAGRLGIGSAIVTRAGPSVKIIRIATKETPATVYNFEVATSHSYFVGGTGSDRDRGWLWVHNQCITPEIRTDVARVLRRINRGDPHPYTQDGTTFNNRTVTGRTAPELPVQPPGYYKEFTVPTPGATTRGARRIVTGQNGEIYYTGDHYNSFTKLR